MFRSSSFLAAAVTTAALLAPAASAQALVNGGSIDSSLTAPGQTNRHTFVANGGEGFQIQVVDLQAGALDPRVQVLDPAGNSIGLRVATDVARVAGVAPRSGTYTVEVNDGNSGMTQTGPYRVYYTRAPGADEGGALPNGGVVSGSIDVGDLDSFTFSMQAGEEYQLRYADTGPTALDPTMTIYDPMGSVVATNVSTDVAALAEVAPFSGTYTVVLGDGNSQPAATGAYDLYFARMPGANAGGRLSSGGSINDAIVVGEIDSYTFTVTAGDYYMLRLADLGATALDPVLWLYDPRGCRVVTDVDTSVAGLRGVAVFSGVYTVLVTDGNSNPAATGAYRLNYQRVPGRVSSGRLPVGSSIMGSIALGDLDSYTFDLRSGEAFVIQVSDTLVTALDPALFVFDPRGALLGTAIDTTVTRFTGIATLSGSYTAVLADGNSSPSAVGSYEIFYERLPGATGEPLFPGTVATGALTQGELDSYTFDLEVGDSYRMHVVDTGNTSLDPFVQLYDPRGVLVTQRVATVTTALAGTADRSGTYTMLVSDGNSSPSATGAYEIHYARAPGANEHGYLASGRVANETIDLGDLDSYTFRARAGETAQITMTDVGNTSLDPALVLYGPFGRLLASTVNTSSAQITRLLTRSGNYTVLAFDGNSQPTATGGYTIQVTGAGAYGNSGCVNEGPPVLTGRPSLATGFGIQAVPFTGNCNGPSVVVLGPCLPNTLLLRAPLTCGPCGMDIASASLSGAGSVTLPPLPASLAGLTVCAQSVCSTTFCLRLSASLSITLEP